MTAQFLEIEGLSLSYGKEAVLGDISLECFRGQRVGILGRSGAGKTTLLRLIAGLARPSRGHITIDGQSPVQFRRAGRIGFVFQEPTLLPFLSSSENIALSSRLKRSGTRSSNIGDGTYAHVIAAMRVADFLTKRPDELSGGMKTRVALARALYGTPELLLLDEPFNGLDDVIKEDIYIDLHGAQVARGATIILVTHNLLEVAFLSDSIFVLSGGAKGAQLGTRIDVPFGQDRSIDLLYSSEFSTFTRSLRDQLRGGGA